MIRKIIAILFIFHSSLIAQTAPDIDFTDLNGVSHNLYDYLDEGKSVLLDFFIVNCTPCQEGAGYLDAFYENYGPEGTDQLQVISLEVYNNSDPIVQETITNWGITNPVVNLDAIPESYTPFVPFYPTYIMVCLDRSMSIITDFNHPLTILEWELAMNSCNYGFNYTDVNILEPEIIHCQDYVFAHLNIGNVGSSFVNNIDIEVYVDSVYHSTIEWNYLLPPGSTTNDAFFPIIFESFDIEGDEITFNINVDDDINFVNNVVNHQLEDEIITLHKDIKIEIQNDYYPGDLYWSLANSSGDIIAFGDGVNYDAAELISIELVLDTSTCYTFIIEDQYGDGICCAHGDGYYQITAGEDTLIFNNTFLTHKMHAFYVDAFIGIEEGFDLNNQITHTEFFNLSGQKVNSPKHAGVYIQKDWYENGYSTCEKIILPKQ
jgi:thiol-disulfide isomerase/thioredoxin